VQEENDDQFNELEDIENLESVIIEGGGDIIRESMINSGYVIEA
jgi:hypothetical protein